MARVDFEISVDWNTQSIVDLPRQVEQLFRKALRRALHERAIVRAGREHAQMIQVFVKNKAVHFRELVQVNFCGTFELDIRSELNFVARPTLNRYRASRRSDQSNCAPVRKMTCLTPRRSTCQELYFRRGGFLRRDRSYTKKQDGEQQKDFPFPHRVHSSVVWRIRIG